MVNKHGVQTCNGTPRAKFIAACFGVSISLNECRVKQWVESENLPILMLYPRNKSVPGSCDQGTFYFLTFYDVLLQTPHTWTAKGPKGRAPVWVNAVNAHIYCLTNPLDNE